MTVLTDDIVKRLHTDSESTVDDPPEEGEYVDPTPLSPPPNVQDKNLRSRVDMGEWDNLQDIAAFNALSPEGQLMVRTEAIDNRIHQLEVRLPMLLNQYLHDSYIQVLKKIHALRKTKGAMFYFFYKNQGLRDLPGQTDH
jgi:hypothetical protein